MNELHEDFDWDELERRLGEATNGGKRIDHEDTCKAVLALLAWAVEPVVRKRRHANVKPPLTISRRVVALAWVMCPELFSADGKEARSLSEVANALKLHKAVLSEETAEFSKKFGFRNKFQRGHGWNFNPDKKGKK